jgi:hypothetical protein
MAFPKGHPGEGGSFRKVQFSYFGTKPVTNWFGWLAGEPQWVLAHTQPLPSKPCLTWITSNQLKCVRCTSHTQPEWIAYVPVYRERDGAPVVVIVHESAADKLEGLKYPDYVMVLREGGEIRSRCVRRCRGNGSAPR